MYIHIQETQAQHRQRDRRQKKDNWDEWNAWKHYVYLHKHLWAIHRSHTSILGVWFLDDNGPCLKSYIVMVSEEVSVVSHTNAIKGFAICPLSAMLCLIYPAAKLLFERSEWQFRKSLHKLDKPSDPSTPYGWGPLRNSRMKAAFKSAPHLASLDLQSPAWML